MAFTLIRRTTSPSVGDEFEEVVPWRLSSRSRRSGRSSWTAPTPACWPSSTASSSASATGQGTSLPPTGHPDPQAERWLGLRDPARQLSVAFQPVPTLPRATWPEGPVPQQLHLDLTVTTKADLDTQHDRALALGAQLLEDLSDDPEEPLRVYADPAGHPFCIFVAPPRVLKVSKPAPLVRIPMRGADKAREPDRGGTRWAPSPRG